MSETQSLRTIGGVIAAIGIVALLVGFAMPPTSTHTSETCVDDPTGFGQECVSGSVTTPNPLRGPVIGAGVLAFIGGLGIYFMGGTETSSQNRGRQSESTVSGGFAEQLREHQHDSSSDDDSRNSSNGVSSRQADSSTIQENIHPIRKRIPSVVAYPITFIVGAFACGIAFVFPAALVNSQGIGFLIGLLVGGIWGVLAWYGLDKSSIRFASISFTYLIVFAVGVFVMTALLGLLGIGNTTVSGEIVFLLGIIGILVVWHYTRRNYLPEFTTA